MSTNSDFIDTYCRHVVASAISRRKALSRYIIGNKRAYYESLQRVTTEGAWEDDWILYMLAGIRETAEWSNRKIHAIRDLPDETSARMRRDLPKIYSRELAEVIFVNPYCRISDVVSAGIAKRQAAAV
jgi:Fic family protein